MKKAILFLFAALLVPNFAQAEGRYGSAGCGLGSMIIKDDGAMQILAATTNGTFASQTFGITSGTSNCTSAGVVKADRQREAFAEAVLPHILDDMAAGEGEYIGTLGELYGCDANAIEDFSRTAQSKMSKVCDGENCSKASSFLTAFEAEMSENSNLISSCPKIVAGN